MSLAFLKEKKVSSPVKSTQRYNPAAVLMRGVHKVTNEVRDFTAADVNALRHNRDSGFRRKEWAFSCPCCGDQAHAKHVKQSDGDNPKSTHWRLRKGDWHSNEDCEHHSPLEAHMRLSNIPVQRRGSDNLLELSLRLPKIKPDIDAHFDSASHIPSNVKPKIRNSKTAKFVSVAQIDELYRCLTVEQRESVIIRNGKDKRSLSDMRLEDGQGLMTKMGDSQAKHFIVPVQIDWGNCTVSEEHKGYWFVQAYAGGDCLAGVLVSDDVMALYEGGSIHPDQSIVMRINAETAGSDLKLSGVITNISDFSRGKKLNIAMPVPSQLVDDQWQMTL